MRHLLTINQNKIEVLQKGISGIPIIILTGMGCSFDEWYEVTETISKSNRVIMFHRPGLGESEIHNEERNTHAVVNEINKLIHLLELCEPVLLVGHSVHMDRPDIIVQSIREMNALLNLYEKG